MNSHELLEATILMNSFEYDYNYRACLPVPIHVPGQLSFF